MKHIFYFLLAICFLSQPLQAQDCRDLSKHIKAMQSAEAYLKAGQYKDAYEEYNAAKVFCKERGARADVLKDSVFVVIDDKLKEIKRANEGLVKPLIKLFDDFVYAADYEQAKDILEKAVEIDRQLNYAGKETFTYAYLQLIYYHTACGRENLSSLHKQHLRMAAQLSKAMLLYRAEKNKLNTSGDTLQYLQTILKEYAKVEDLTKLQNRYYPTMIKVEGDTFRMENEEKEDTTKYYVSLSDYEIAQTEVTVHQYLLFCDASGYRRPDAPSWGWRGDNPAVNVSWGDAAAYNNWLTKQQNLLNARKDSLVYSLDGKAEWVWKDVGDCDSCKRRDAEISLIYRPTVKGYRLPTEAEWQFAAAGGKKGINNKYEYSGSNSINDVAWYSSNTTTHTEVVATKKENDLDLYDMSGSIWEWCQDWRNPYPKDAPAAAPLSDPCSDISGDSRVLRGGSWLDDADVCRVVFRYDYSPGSRYSGDGFRPARTL